MCPSWVYGSGAYEEPAISSDFDEGRADGRTDGRAKPVKRPIRTASYIIILMRSVHCMPLTEALIHNLYGLSQLSIRHV